jgi:hypothetical protein
MPRIRVTQAPATTKQTRSKAKHYCLVELERKEAAAVIALAKELGLEKIDRVLVMGLEALLENRRRAVWEEETEELEPAENQITLGDAATADLRDLASLLGMERERVVEIAIHGLAVARANRGGK